MAFAACFIFNTDVLTGGTFYVERLPRLVGPGLPGLLLGVVSSPSARLLSAACSTGLTAR